MKLNLKTLLWLVLAICAFLGGMSWSRWNYWNSQHAMETLRDLKKDLNEFKKEVESNRNDIKKLKLPPDTEKKLLGLWNGVERETYILWEKAAKGLDP